MKKIYYSYRQLQNDLKILIQKMDKPFDTIVPIARGGLTIAHLLGEYYNIRKVYSINTIGYDDIKKLDRVEISNIPNLKNTKSALIVDDIVDSGDTLIAVIDILKDRYPDINFYTASIFYKKSAKIAPTWYIREAAHDWIDFFWSIDLKD
ncbi:MAG: phosphoribosyltransferase [Epsilonproteobacteria bacterium]|nr:phosphoribosyltransferase [Campylobacterota bacterium]